MSERWRLFVAVPIGDELRSTLAAAAREWHHRPDLAGLRWIDPDSWHITLAFLGHVEADRLPGIGGVVREIAARHGPMTLTGGKLGAFPSAGRARVAWYGIVDANGGLKYLARDLRAGLDVDDRQALRPHVSIARVRREPVDLRAFLADVRGPSLTLRTDRVELLRSHIGRGPARYELIASVALGAAVHV